LGIQLEKKEYSPGDIISGTLHFFKDFEDATLKIYQVLILKPKALWKPAEKEHSVLHATDTFWAGSKVPFSLPLSPSAYPNFKVEHSTISWKLRVIISKSFHHADVAEVGLKILPLSF
jgi:hypothetical protein